MKINQCQRYKQAQEWNAASKRVEIMDKLPPLPSEREENKQKVDEKPNKIYVIIASVILISIVFTTVFISIILWQIGIFTEPSDDLVSVFGFNKIKPKTSEFKAYENGSITGSFTNDVGTGINITHFQIRNNNHQKYCEKSTIISDKMPISAGSNFLVRADHCNKKKEASGNEFDLEFEFTYTIITGNMITTHRESGILKGVFE